MSIKTQDIFASADSFMHAGTKGMLWGVRHWQNKDGTLTEEGRARYNAFRRKDGSTGYYMNEKGLKEYNEELKNLTETMTKIDDFEKKAVQPVIKNIANNKEATQLGLENAPNHARIEAMSTEDIKTEIERRTAINALRGLTDKKKTSNYEKTMRAVALVGGITTAALSGVKLYGEIGKLINESLKKEAASALSHSGVKGMKRGYHLFGDYEYTPIGTPAQEEKNLNKISRAKTAEDIKNYQNRQKNVRIDDNAEARAIRRQQDIKNKIKEQAIADNYSRRKQTQQDRYEHYNKRTSDKEAYKLEKKRLDDVAKRQKDMANTNAKNALNLEREKERLSQETIQKELQAEMERQRQQTKNQLQLNRSVEKTTSKTQKRTIRFEEEKIKADQEAEKQRQEAEKQRQEYNKQLADQQVEQERQIENDKKKSRTKAIVIGAAIAAVGALAIKSYMASKGAQTPSAPTGQLNPPKQIDSTHLLGAPSKNYKKPIINDTMKMKVSSVKAGTSPIERVDQSRIVHEPYTRVDQTRQLAAPGENSRTYATKGKYIGKVAVNRFDTNKSFEKTTAKPAKPTKPVSNPAALPAPVTSTRPVSNPVKSIPQQDESKTGTTLMQRIRNGASNKQVANANKEIDRVTNLFPTDGSSNRNAQRVVDRIQDPEKRSAAQQRLNLAYQNKYQRLRDHEYQMERELSDDDSVLNLKNYRNLLEGNNGRNARVKTANNIIENLKNQPASNELDYRNAQHAINKIKDPESRANAQHNLEIVAKRHNRRIV